ncbi:hypothetical protein DFR48_1081, partial [Ciceribacter lividus]
WSSGARPGRPAAAAPGEDSNGTIGEYCSGTDRSDWPRQASSLPSEALATVTTTPSPKRSTAFTRPRSSIGADRGAASKRLNSPPWNGSTGSTIDASSRASETSRRPKPRSSTTPCWTNQPWLHNLNQTASGKAGAVHFRAGSSFHGDGFHTQSRVVAVRACEVGRSGLFWRAISALLTFFRLSLPVLAQ